MAKNYLNLGEMFGWEEGWQSDFSKIKVLDNLAALTNEAYYEMFCILGKDKGLLFYASQRVFSPSVESYDIAKHRKKFLREVENLFLKKRLDAQKKPHLYILTFLEEVSPLSVSFLAKWHLLCRLTQFLSQVLLLKPQH